MAARRKTVLVVDTHEPSRDRLTLTDNLETAVGDAGVDFIGNNPKAVATSDVCNRITIGVRQHHPRRIARSGKKDRAGLRRHGGF